MNKTEKINIFSLGLITKPDAGEEYNTRELYENIVKIIDNNKDAEGKPDKGIDVSIQDADFQGIQNFYITHKDGIR